MPKSSKQPTASPHPTGMYPTLDKMIEDGVPLTREEYLGYDMPEADPDEWQGVELEAQLPPEFRHPDWSKEPGENAEEDEIEPDKEE